MKILLAEDDAVSRRAMEVALGRWGFDVLAAGDGAAAWRILEQKQAPRLALVDWIMPGLDGLELCRKIRARVDAEPVYLIMISGKRAPEDVVTGLEGGADDYVTKPVDLAELRARLKVGARIVELQRTLSDRIRELGETLEHVHRLQGLLPICAYCKKVRDDKNYWQQVEAFLSAHSDLRFSHSVCPECYEKSVRAGVRGAPIPESAAE